MTAQSEALLHLLRDDDPATLRLLKNQLAQRGPSALPELRGLLALADPVAARQLRLVIVAIEADVADADFAKFCAGFGQDGDLEDAAWRLAAILLPGEDFTPQRALLDAWGREVVRRFAKADSELDRIETLVEYLADEVGLRGNVEDYDNLSNSLLPEVIETRLGLPITLSLVYILVGRRAGLTLSGAGLPGHFLVRYGPHFFDPFHGGARVGLDECRARAAQHGVALTPSTLQPYPAPQFLTRILTNLHILADKSDPPLASKLADWIEAIAVAGTAR